MKSEGGKAKDEKRRRESEGGKANKARRREKRFLADGALRRKSIGVKNATSESMLYRQNYAGYQVYQSLGYRQVPLKLPTSTLYNTYVSLQAWNFSWFGTLNTIDTLNTIEIHMVLVMVMVKKVTILDTSRLPTYLPNLPYFKSIEVSPLALI